MSRGHRTDNYGVSQIDHGSQRPYGKCQRCKQVKPIIWVSRDRCLCNRCMKAVGATPFSPPALTSQSENFPFKIHQPRRQYAPSPSIKKVPPNLRPTVEKPVEKQKPIPKPELSPEEKAYRREQNRQRKTARKQRIAKEQGRAYGARPETLERWDQNRLAVEQARKHRLAQEQNRQDQ